MEIDMRYATNNWQGNVNHSPIPVHYTDTINGDLVCRDDLWLTTTKHLAPEIDEALRLAVERVRADFENAGDKYPAIRKLLAFAEAAMSMGHNKE